MKNLDFFYIYSHKTFATEMCKRQTSLVFPDSKIFEYEEDVFQNKEVNSVTGSTYSYLTRDEAYLFYKLLDKSIKESDAIFMMILEPDVFISKKPTYYPEMAGGMLHNTILESTQQLIKDKIGLSQPCYSMAGGSVISVEHWKNNCHDLTLEDIELFYEIWNESRFGDALISMILWKFKMTIEDWEELFESGGPSDRKINASIYHGLKHWYNYE